MNVNKSQCVMSKYGLHQGLGEIKKMLIARDGVSQVKAASYLLEILEDDVAKDAKSTSLADFILKEDTIIFLCEAMATTDCCLMEKLVATLHILSRSDEMAKQRDSLCAAEASLRAAHFLAPLTAGSDGSQPADRVHASTLHLLAVILRRWSSVRGGYPVSEACRPEQLLACVKSLYSSVGNKIHNALQGQEAVPITGSCKRPPPIVLLAAADALSALVLAIAEETKPPSVRYLTDFKSPISVITAVLDVVMRLEGAEALEITCKLSQAAVNYCSRSLSERESEEKSKKVAQDHDFVIFFKDVVDTFVSNVVDTEKYLAYKKTVCVVSVLDVIMNAPISGPVRSQLAYHLASKGFLKWLPGMIHISDTKVITEPSTLWRDCGGTNLEGIENLSLRSARTRPTVIEQFGGRRLLVSILAALVSDLLPESSLFEAPKLAAVASALPNDVHDWGRLIASVNSLAEMRAFVLLWAYCLCSCCDGLQSTQELVATVLPHLTRFLTVFSKDHLMGLSQALLKLIWLVYAVLFLSSDGNEADTSKMDCTESASERLVSILEAKESLQTVYTHHPALLYWVFTVSCLKLQREVALWLEHEDTQLALGDLVRTKRDAAFRLLDVIQTGRDVVATRGAALLEMALTRVEADGDGKPEEEKSCNAERLHLAATIWSILPTVLAHATESELGSLRANLLLALAHRAAVVVTGSVGEECQDVVAIGKVCGGYEVRTACHLATVLATFSDFSNPPPLFQCNALKVAILLLRFSKHHTDSRVFTILSVHIGLSKVLVSSVISKTVQDPLIQISSVNLLTMLLKCQKFFSVSHSTEVAIIPADEILRLLEKCGQLAVAVIEMVEAQLELRRSSEKPLLQLDYETPTFWRAFFFRLQNMCVLDIPEISLPAWNCMTILLSSEVCDFAVRRHLATQPWTHFLLKTVLASGPSKLAQVLHPQRNDSSAKAPPPEILRFILAFIRAPLEVDHRFRTIPSPDMMTETCRVLGTALAEWTCSRGHFTLTERDIAKELLSCGASLPSEIIDGLRKALSLPQYTPK